MLFHLHVVQQAFLRTWREEPRDTPYPTFDDTPSLGGWGRTTCGEMESHVAALTDAELTRPMPVPWVEHVMTRLGRPPGTTTVGDTLVHVALHTAYHRGQINTRLRELGGAPPLVDYISSIWFGRPEAEWPDFPPAT